MFPLDFATHPTLITLNNPNSKTYFSQEFVSQLQFPKKWAQNTAMFTKSRFGQPLGVGSRAGGLFWHLSWDDVGPLPGGDRWPGVARDADALDARDLALDGGAVLYLHCLYGLCVAATGFRDIKKTRKNGDLGCFLGVGSSINGDSTDKHGWFAGYFAGYLWLVWELTGWVIDPKKSGNWRRWSRYHMPHGCHMFRARLKETEASEFEVLQGSMKYISFDERCFQSCKIVVG